MSAEDVAVKILLYAKKLGQENVQKQLDFVDAEHFPKRNPANGLLMKNPFAFLLGVIYDQGQRASRAWYYPYQLKQRLNIISPAQVSNITLEEMDNIFESTKPLLFYWRLASARTLRAAYRVCRYYEENTQQIWLKDSPSPAEIQRRFAEFDGIGQKKASMATNILYRDLKWIEVKQTHLKEIDASNDRHVRRVFLRSGIMDNDDENTLVEKARLLSPNYPGALDAPTWFIGQKFCLNASPKCSECPISDVCAKHTYFTVR